MGSWGGGIAAGNVGGPVHAAVGCHVGRGSAHVRQLCDARSGGEQGGGGSLYLLSSM